MACFVKIFVLVLVAILGLAASLPLYEDSEGAASHHEHGRVQIKVFRGPDEHSGHDHFAPWGYWVKQPADEGHH